jgi:hypothetical protein
VGPDLLKALVRNTELQELLKTDDEAVTEAHHGLIRGLVRMSKSGRSGAIYSEFHLGQCRLYVSAFTREPVAFHRHCGRGPRERLPYHMPCHTIGAWGANLTRKQTGLA